MQCAGDFRSGHAPGESLAGFCKVPERLITKGHVLPQTGTPVASKWMTENHGKGEERICAYQ